MQGAASRTIEEKINCPLTCTLWKVHGSTGPLDGVKRLHVPSEAKSLAERIIHVRTFCGRMQLLDAVMERRPDGAREERCKDSSRCLSQYKKESRREKRFGFTASKISSATTTGISS